MLVLLVEDDSDYSEIISYTLERDGHEVVAVDSSRRATRFAEQKPPDLAVLDVMLPDGSGLDLCSSLRRVRPTMPVLFLSSLDRTTDVIAGLNAGGDDYLVKPFSPAELVARTRALMRRSTSRQEEAGRPHEILRNGHLLLDLTQHEASFRSAPLGCTPIEVDILAQLATYPGQALSHAFLTEKVWGYKNVNDATLLKGHISSIRKKLRDAGGNEEMVRTVHGVGYSFTPELAR